MEVPGKTIANEPSAWPALSRRRCLIAAVLLAVGTSWYFWQSPNNEGQWLAGEWTNIQIYSDGARAERIWLFEPGGRVTCTNVFVTTGKTASSSTQKFAGQWTVRGGSLFIKFDRSTLRDIFLTASWAYAKVHNTFTGGNLKLIDHESAEGELVQKARDQFTVTWLNASSPAESEAPQTWTRVP